MKICRFFPVLLMMVLLSSPMSAQDAPNEKAKVIGIDHSDFVSEIYPKMKRPLIILFGSNYCGYSRSQMKLLNKIVKESDYYKYVDFYSVNADTDENYEWLKKIYEDEELEALGTPTWVFYYGTKGDDDDIELAEVGNFTSDQLCDAIENLIDWFDTAVGYPEDN